MAVGNKRGFEKNGAWSGKLRKGRKGPIGGRGKTGDRGSTTSVRQRMVPI